MIGDATVALLLTLFVTLLGEQAAVFSVAF